MIALSHRSYTILIQMAALGAPVASDTFVALLGTPTLLWRVLHSVGYAEPPRYFWSEVVTEGQWRFSVKSVWYAETPHYFLGSQQNLSGIR